MIDILAIFKFIQNASIPIESVVIGKEDDRNTWRIVFKKEATEEQKKMLQNLQQEHILLVNEQNNFELVPYAHITEAANGSKELRAFIFERQNVSSYDTFNIQVYNMPS